MGAWIVNSVGCGGTSRGAVVVTSGRIIGEGVSGTVSGSGGVRNRRQFQRRLGHQLRSPFRPQWLRSVPAIRRLQRNVDSVEAVKLCLFSRLSLTP
jgi:deoxycytidylate deaminase